MKRFNTLWAAACAALLLGSALPAPVAAQGGIYKCKQANGNLVIQEVPCDYGSSQTTVRESPAKAQADAARAAKSQRLSDFRIQGELVPPERQVCVQAGIQVFDSLEARDPAGRAHRPLVADEACKRAVTKLRPGAPQMSAQALRQSDNLCAQICQNAWFALHQERIERCGAQQVCP